MIEDTAIEHYRKTGRTPFAGSGLIRYDHHRYNEMETYYLLNYERFKVLLSDATDQEHEKLIVRTIGLFERIIKQYDDFVVTTFFQKLIDELKAEKDKKIMLWDPFRLALIENNYLSDVSLPTFYEVFTNHRLPPNENKILPGNAMRKNYAVYLADVYGFKDLGQLMQCFEIQIAPNNRGYKIPKKFRQICNIAPI
jgi:hypothetical protein